jgi:signal transduction histidine kinase
VYQKTGDLPRAFSAANKALELAKESNALIREKYAYELLSNLYSASGDHLKALDHLKESIVVNDSIFSMEKNKQEENLSSRLERQQKEAQIKILQQDNELRMARLQLQEDEISQKNFYLIGVIIVMLFLASLLFIIYWQTLSRKKYINLIEKKNSEIQLQADELNELNQKLISLNENLEHQAEERANKIIEQNYKIDEYAFINSQRLRAPVATILGIKNLIDAHYVDEEEQKKLIEQVLFEVKKIDLVVREINKIIE